MDLSFSLPVLAKVISPPPQVGGFRLSFCIIQSGFSWLFLHYRNNPHAAAIENLDGMEIS